MKKKIIFGTLFVILVTVTTFAIVMIIKGTGAPGLAPADSDTTPPAVSMPVGVIETLQPRTSFIVESNENISIVNKDKYKLYPLESDNEKKLYVLEIFNTALGRSSPRIEVQDDSGNLIELKPSITRDNFSFPVGLKDIPEFDPYIYVNGDDITANVKKGVKLYTTYAPTDLDFLNL